MGVVDMGVACAWLTRHPADTRLKWAILELVTLRPLKAMSEEQLKAFWEAVQADAGLQEKLSAAKDADAVVAIAKAAGFEISVEEVTSQLQRQAELSDEQLSAASGGNLAQCIEDIPKIYQMKWDTAPKICTDIEKIVRHPIDTLLPNQGTIITNEYKNTD